VVDVGGGNGETLAQVLLATKSLRGVVFDRPRAREQAAQNIARHGLADRVEFQGGDFFESVPDGGDVYLLQRILHDWDDDDCARILGRVARVLSPQARVIVAEELLGSGGPDDHAVAIDLGMLAITGGRERSRPEFEALAHRAGLRLVGAHRTDCGLWALELAP